MIFRDSKGTGARRVKAIRRSGVAEDCGGSDCAQHAYCELMPYVAKLSELDGAVDVAGLASKELGPGKAQAELCAAASSLLSRVQRFVPPIAAEARR